ncbi:hypothetical protein [Solemya velum gill symbiont]|uniref:hypothetical protein n=1 Tax=Solemya velum gill symbiont TaxID=2340 RepID=UPI0018A7F7A1|nr:hypothetical protein [Solemya velum gill symbiont]
MNKYKLLFERKLSNKSLRKLLKADPKSWLAPLKSRAAKVTYQDHKAGVAVFGGK